MKNYYEILGLSTTASEHEIKRVYRRLAITYHPDKNPSPEAAIFFREVNEAYEILGDHTRRAYYDQLLLGAGPSTPINEPAPAWHRDPVYRKRRQAGYKPKPSGPSPTMVLMQSSLRYINIILWISLSYCMLLLVDYGLPTQVIQEYVADIDPSKKSPKVLLISGGYRIPVDESVPIHFPPGSEVKIHKSLLFSLLVKIENAPGDYVVDKLVSIYRIFFFWPCSLILVSAMGLFHERGTEFKFNTGVVAAILLFLNIIFFFISRV
ncbi:MAG: hypothetical protein DI538_08680 [Azospira oryzae]|nr:MAG: hypothetical protein DI538_08680 [Azospira oryzae]